MPAERRTSSRISTSASSSAPSSATSASNSSSKSKAKPAKSKLTPAAPPSISTAPSSSLLPPPAASTPKYLLLFKSLNVSSHNRISMPVLTSHVLAFLQAAQTNSSSSSIPALPPITVTSYLQSGNLILSNLPSNPNSTEPPFSLQALETYLSTHAHIDSTLFLRTLPSLTHLLTSSPFLTGPLGSDLETKVHVVFLERTPRRAELEELRERMRKDGVGEEVWWPGEVDGEKEAMEVMLSLPNGVGKAKCGAGVVEKVLGMKTTMRGWRSLRACAGLLE